MQLSRLVAENVLAFDQKFWLRVAARSDTAGSTEEKEKYAIQCQPVVDMTPLSPMLIAEFCWQTECVGEHNSQAHREDCAEDRHRS